MPGNALNQVVREYTGFGRLAREYQEHSGVKDESTLYIEYDYADASSGLRPVSLRYPNGRLLHYTYGATNSRADVLGRLDAICDDNAGSPGATLAQYTYLGLDTVVVEDYAEPQIKLDLWGGTSAMYQGFDRFGRIVDHRWRDYAFSVDADRIQLGYDRASNRLWRANPVAAAQNPAVHLDELYQYDGVSQLIGLERGQLSTGRDAVTNKAFAEDWSLDPTGNWSAFRQDANGNGTWDLDQARVHNKANEVTAASSWATPTHDRAGNMTSMPKPTSPTDAFCATFDAWNRMVKIEDGEDTVAEYAYTGDNRRVIKEIYSGGVLSETRHFYYTDQWQCLEERTALDGTVAAEPDVQYIWGPQYVDHLILRDRQITTSGTVTERLYALRDPNWNVTALVDILGKPLERFTYTAYGTVEVRTSAFQPTAAASAYAWPYTYTARRLDEETGLMHYRNRMYHPELGRFVGRDPVGYEAGDVNLYRYVENRSLTTTDASGLRPNDKRAGGMGYYFGSEWLADLCCSEKATRLIPIPGIVAMPLPIPMGPAGGHNETYAFPATPPRLLGGGGAGPCIILVVNCSGVVRVFHFAVGDSPRATLNRFGWVPTCDAIICGGDNSGQSNCLADDVHAAAMGVGVTIAGVSGGSGCGVTAAGGWYEYP